MMGTGDSLYAFAWLSASQTPHIPFVHDVLTPLLSALWQHLC